ncbi:hypothetical protein JI435_067060, partial [Parastagonospora nodorum SN15]
LTGIFMPWVQSTMTPTSCALTRRRCAGGAIVTPDQPQPHPCVAITPTRGCSFQDTVLVNPRGPFATPPRRARLSVPSLSGPHTLLLVQIEPSSHRTWSVWCFQHTCRFGKREDLDERALVAGRDWLKAV